MIRWFHLLLLLFSTNPAHLNPTNNFHPRSNQSYNRYLLQQPSGPILPIEGWHNNLNSVASEKYKAEEGWFGKNNFVGKEDPRYGEGEEEEAMTNEKARELVDVSLHPLGERALMENGILDLAKTAFQSLRGDTAEKLQLPEDRERLVELVRTLLKPNSGSLTTPGFLERLLDQKTELNIGLRKESNPNAKIEMEEDWAGGIEGQVQQHQKPQPVLLLLKGWLLHV